MLALLLRLKIIYAIIDLKLGIDNHELNLMNEEHCTELDMINDENNAVFISSPGTGRSSYSCILVIFIS